MKGIINIQGAIGYYEDEQCVEFLDVVKQVKKQPKATSFKVIINSPGGYMDVGFDIYNYLKSLKVPITTVGSGMVASIATIIFMSGNTRVIRPGTKFMIHLPQGGIDGTAEEIETYLGEMKKAEKTIVDFYVNNFQLTKEAIFPLLKNETFIENTELLELGITTGEVLNIAAKFNFNKKHKKMKKNKKTNKKDQDILNKIWNALKGKKPVNKILFDAEQKEVDFYELEDDAIPSIGDKARIEGVDAMGEIVMASKDTYVFIEGGVLDDILKFVAEGEAIEELLENFKDVVEGETVSEIVNNIKKIKKDKEKSEAKVISLKAENKKINKVVDKIKKIENNYNVDEKKKKPSKKEEKGLSRFQKAKKNIA